MAHKYPQFGGERDKKTEERRYERSPMVPPAMMVPGSIVIWSHSTRMLKRVADRVFNMDRDTLELTPTQGK